MIDMIIIDMIVVIGMIVGNVMIDMTEIEIMSKYLFLLLNLIKIRYIAYFYYNL